MTSDVWDKDLAEIDSLLVGKWIEIPKESVISVALTRENIDCIYNAISSLILSQVLNTLGTSSYIKNERAEALKKLESSMEASAEALQKLNIIYAGIMQQAVIHEQ